MSEIWEEEIAGFITPEPYRLAENPTAAKKFDINWKRFQEYVDAQEAVLVLDEGGQIQALTPEARRLLDYRPEQPITPSFFAHVHTKGLYRVLRDVAEMTFHDRQEASWRVQLRTGQGRWRWIDATVSNRLDQPARALFIHLKALDLMA